jgi:hypothetical protein
MRKAMPSVNDTRALLIPSCTVGFRFSFISSYKLMFTHKGYKVWQFR